MIRSTGTPIATKTDLNDDNKNQRFPLHLNLTKMSIFDTSKDATTNRNFQQNEGKELKHLYVLPVLLLEFLALALTRAVMPAILLDAFKDKVYFIMGCVEFIRGLLAFIMCPLFGKISDIVGRRNCLFITVLGTCAPVCAMALMPIQLDQSAVDTVEASTFDQAASVATVSQGDEEWVVSNPTLVTQPGPIDRIWIFVTLLAISGMFSSTFPLTFAYISDIVKGKEDRVTAYGLALATFGLSFTIGPMAGGYLARVDDDNNSDESSDTSKNSDLIPVAHPIGQQRVFLCALCLTVLDLLYIYFILPESRPDTRNTDNHSRTGSYEDDDNNSYTSTGSNISSRIKSLKNDILPQSWSPMDALRVFSGDPVLARVGQIAFLYYTSLWAVVSTLMLYAAKRFHLGPERLGELMSALGLSTMVAEAVLVRIIVPAIGEKKSMKVGLLAFTLQCTLLGVATRSYQLFICVLISTLANLVYPSLSSLVSNAVAPDSVGEALGAINGVKALTEGVGPLFFGTLMTLSEGTALPGWPYLIAAAFAFMAYRQTDLLPDDNDEDYLSERYNWNKHSDRIRNGNFKILNWLKSGTRNASNAVKSDAKSIMMQESSKDQSEEEMCLLLSEVDEDTSGIE